MEQCWAFLILVNEQLNPFWLSCSLLPVCMLGCCTNAILILTNKNYINFNNGINIITALGEYSLYNQCHLYHFCHGLYSYGIKSIQT